MKSVVPISFLMPMYNGLAFTQAALRTLEATVDLRPHEVILIDDASIDGTGDFLAKLSPPYRVIRNPVRSGYAIGMNAGVAIARHEILCFLNNDLEFTPNWLAPMLSALENHPDAGVIGNVHISSQHQRYDHMGVVFGDTGAPIHFGKFFTFCPFRGVKNWLAVTAACWLIKKDLFLAAGGFDEVYKNGCEDVDLCLKLDRMGRRNYVANDSVIYHQVSATEGRPDFNLQNGEILMSRWRAYIQAKLSPRDRRLFAFNYLLRFVFHPHRCNYYKLLEAFGILLRFGH